MFLVLLVLAIICEIVAALSSFGWLIDASHPLGWVAFGLVFYFVFQGYEPAVKLRRHE